MCNVVVNCCQINAHMYVYIYKYIYTYIYIYIYAYIHIDMYDCLHVCTYLVLKSQHATQFAVQKDSKLFLEKKIQKKNVTSALHPSHHRFQISQMSALQSSRIE